MKINYCISRTVRKHGKRKTIETQNGKMDVVGLRWNTDDMHRHVRAHILREHPGWSIVGYCNAQP